MRSASRKVIRGMGSDRMYSGFAIQWQLDPESVDPKLLVRAARRIVGLDDAEERSPPRDPSA